MWKLWLHKVKSSKLHKIGKYGKKIGEEIWKIINEIGENRSFHIVSIDTKSAPGLFQSREIIWEMLDTMDDWKLRR